MGVASTAAVGATFDPPDAIFQPAAAPSSTTASSLGSLSADCAKAFVQPNSSSTPNSAYFVTGVPSGILRAFSSTRLSSNTARSKRGWRRGQQVFFRQRPLMLASRYFKHEVYSDYRVKRMNSDERFSIGELSKATGVKVVTIRYYAHVNLMPAPPRTRANYRVYSREHLHRLQFVRRCRDLGFTHDQLRDLLYLSVQSRMRCSGI